MQILSNREEFPFEYLMEKWKFRLQKIAIEKGTCVSYLTYKLTVKNKNSCSSWINKYSQFSMSFSKFEFIHFSLAHWPPSRPPPAEKPPLCCIHLSAALLKTHSLFNSISAKLKTDQQNWLTDIISGVSSGGGSLAAAGAVARDEVDETGPRVIQTLSEIDKVESTFTAIYCHKNGK